MHLKLHSLLAFSTIDFKKIHNISASQKPILDDCEVVVVLRESGIGGVGVGDV